MSTSTPFIPPRTSAPTSRRTAISIICWRSSKTLGIEKHEILHTAQSMFHDHVPANKHGLASCWIDRRRDQKGFGATMNPGKMPKVGFRFASLADLVEAHQAEQGG